MLYNIIENCPEFLLFIIYGLIIRWMVMTITLMLKIPLPYLPSVLGVGAIVYYFSLDGYYDHLEYVNGFVMIGLFLPELFKLLNNMHTEKKEKSK